MDSSSKSGLENKYLDACCCCLEPACFKNISSEYYTFGQKEVYENMLKDTFNIQVMNYNENGKSTIHRQPFCESCVSRLRDAAVFKQTVLDSQEVFRKHFEMMKDCGEGDNHNPGLAETSDIKVEALPLDRAEYEADDAFDDDEILANLKTELRPVEELPAEQTPRKRCLDRRSKLKKCKIKPHIADSCSEDKTDSQDWRKILERRGDGPILRENSLKLLANSTGCVFQWNKSRYRCFCCKEPFSDLTSLRDHTNNKHTLDQIKRKIIIQQNRLVKVEISSLNCKLCLQKTEDLTELRKHLTDAHKIEFVKKDDLLVPFKINGQLQCQICSENFTVFRLLNIHMNKHYQKHVCHICGSGFSNAVFLNMHKTRSHKPFHCKTCDSVFSSKSDKKAHDMSVHDVKFERKLRFPCPYCPQRFFQEQFRVLHLVEKHGMVKPEHKCDVCCKVFVTKSLCNNHVKTVHKKEKKQECDICHKLFYNKSDVIRHRVTHTGEKKFSCSVCGSPFATKDSLRRHVRRTHVGMQ